MAQRFSPRVLSRLPQWFFFLACLVVGVRFYLFCRFAQGAGPAVGRPAAVEGFLPISALLGARHLLDGGGYDPVHPAGLTIFLAALVMAFLFRKGFCGHVCPVGFVATRLGRLGQRLGLARSVPPRLGAVLGLPKYLLLAFFLFTTFFGMDAAAVAGFLRSSYNLTADARMLLFFTRPGLTAVLVLGGLLLLGLVFRGSFCRWLCPYGALLGLLAKVGPTSLRRDADTCTGCGRCRTVCPVDLPVDAGPRPLTCSGCAACVTACPKSARAVEFRFAGRRAPWWLTAGGVCAVFLLAYVAANALGAWDTSVPRTMLARLYAAALGG